MYRNKDGEFDNKLSENVVISDYTGSFNITGIKAIVADVLDKTKHLSYWIWYQRPSPEAGITPDAIRSLIIRYTHLEHQGCIGLGILNQNVLIKSFKLPEDGTIAIPIKISRNEATIFHFFKELMASIQIVSDIESKQKRKRALMQDAEATLTKFLESCELMKISEQEICELIGDGYRNYASLSTKQINIMQAVMVFERLVMFRFDGDNNRVIQWFSQYDSQLGYQPREKITSAESLYELLTQVNDTGDYTQLKNTARLGL